MVGYGDMRFTDPSVKIGTNPRLRKWLAERVGQENPEVLLLTGDMPYVGAKPCRLAGLSRRDGTLAQKPGSAAPHDRQSRGARRLQQGIANYLQELSGHSWSSLLFSADGQRGSDLAGYDIASGGTNAQATWFAAQLDHLPKQVEFLFILYHTPWVVDEQSKLFTNLPSKEALTLRHLLEIHLHKMHAKVIVFNGHIHNYERFERNGVEYIISGRRRGGALSTAVSGIGGPLQGHGFPVYHYLTSTIEAVACTP